MARSLSLVPAPTVAVFFCLAAAAALAATGCGGGSEAAGASITFDACAPLALVLDPGVSPEQQQGIADALALWNRSASARLSIATGAPGAAVPVHFQRAAAPFHGFYDAAAGQLFINDDLVDHERVVTAAHEVGHAFGLSHVPPDQRSSVMNAGNLVVEPNAGDVDALASLWGRCAP